MKKILILTNSSEGLYDFRGELVWELVKAYQVYISVPDTIAAEKLKEAGCQVILTEMNRRGMNPVQDVKLLMSYHKLMKKIRPHCILTYTIKPNVYGGLCAGVGKIPFLPTITGLGTAFQSEGVVNQLVKTLYRWAFQKAAVVFFQNGRNRDVFMESNLLTGRTRVVKGSGVNLQKHRKEPYPGREKPRFLYVGRVMKEKGIEEFLAVALRYANRAEFVIIGDYEEDYHRQVEKAVTEGWLTFHGPQRDVHSFYREADAVIVASYHEGMSNVVLEAAATGRPVLATNIHGCREAVEDNLTGLLFAPASVAALEEAVETFLSLPVRRREEMGQAARAKMEQEFDRSQIVQIYLEEIKQAVKTAE